MKMTQSHPGLYQRCPWGLLNFQLQMQSSWRTCVLLAYQTFMRHQAQRICATAEMALSDPFKFVDQAESICHCMLMHPASVSSAPCRSHDTAVEAVPCHGRPDQQLLQLFQRAQHPDYHRDPSSHTDAEADRARTC